MLGIKDFVLEPAEKYDETKEDDVPEKPEAICKLGQIWKLGDHRLMCGDSTNIEDVEKLMDGQKADMVFTDPPYGISIVNVGASSKTGFVGAKKAPSQLAKAREYRPVAGDDEPFDPSLTLGLDAKTVILWGANHYASKLPDRPQWLIWDKKLESGSLDHNNFSDCELAWTNQTALSAKIYRHTWAGMLRKGERKEELKDRVHPTQKPVGLCVDVISDFSKENESVLDLFGGSGSTLIACEKIKRKCSIMELDEHYCDVIITRWEEYTGKKAELLNG
jgi:DNA modification methylase